MTKEARYWIGEVPKEDDFGCPISHEVGGIFYDAKSRQGPWGFMAPSSFFLETYGKLGTGWGQKYKKQADGRWLKIEG